MSRTPIPKNLVHDPKDTKRIAGEFDRLCAGAEELILQYTRDQEDAREMAERVDRLMDAQFNAEMRD